MEGHPPGALEAARASAHADLEEWNAKPEEAKAALISNGFRAPKPWPGDDVWLNSTKPKKVRSKPYSLPQAADECKALAERAGWLRVRVRELSSEVPA